MKLAVFYHCWLPNDSAHDLLCEQALALVESGLYSECDEMHVGLNGDPMGSCIVSSVLPKSEIQTDPDNRLGEAFTIKLLQKWLTGKAGWFVCYHHTKAATGGRDAYERWRRCLERVVIRNWRTCVRDLESGYETVGGHWHRNVDQQYWAGNFWWATSEYLSSLPPVSDKVNNGKSYEAEVWIGKCGRIPRIADYARHTLMLGC